jgi:signal peptidase II
MEAATERATSIRPTVVLAGTALGLYGADQVSKAIVVATVEPGERFDVVGQLIQLWHVHNAGAAFSILPGATWLFVPVTVLAIGMVVYFHRTLHDRGPWIHVILGAILAGALGNLTDRLRLGWVTDFVSIGFGEVRFPTFNIADSAVVLGIGALVIYLTFLERPRSAEAMP